MKKGKTEVVFLIDRSGSMGGLVSDTIEGYNSFIDNQKLVEGEATVTTVLFNNRVDVLHNGVDIKEISPLTKVQYRVGGMTSLLDAIGITIDTVGDRLHKTKEEDRPSNVIFVITTDGQENSSKEYTKKQIQEMITTQTEIYNWQFIFLGANIDAVGEAESLGIRGAFASSYSANARGTDSLYNSMSKAVSDYRATGQVASNWSSDIK